MEFFENLENLFLQQNHIEFIGVNAFQFNLKLQMLNLAHNRDWEPFDRSIDIRITRLRRKIEPDPAKPQIIKTVRGAGYIYVVGDG